MCPRWPEFSDPKSSKTGVRSHPYPIASQTYCPFYLSFLPYLDQSEIDFEWTRIYRRQKEQATCRRGRGRLWVQLTTRDSARALRDADHNCLGRRHDASRSRVFDTARYGKARFVPVPGTRCSALHFPISRRLSAGDHSPNGVPIRKPVPAQARTAPVNTLSRRFVIGSYPAEAASHCAGFLFRPPSEAEVSDHAFIF